MKNVKDNGRKIITNGEIIMEQWRLYFEELNKWETNEVKEENETTDLLETEQVTLEAINKVKPVATNKIKLVIDMSPEIIKYVGEKGIKNIRTLINVKCKNMV